MANKSVGVGLGVPKDVRLQVIYDTGDKYFAGSDGHIYCESYSRRTAKYPQPFRVSECIGSKGYSFVTFIVGGKRTNQQVHALICRAFHGERPKGCHCTRHKDGKKQNNVPDNLCWGTYSENEADKRRHGTAAIGSKHGHAVLTEDAVRIMRFAIPRGLWTPRQAADTFGVHPATIRNIVNGRGWQHVK